MANLIPTPSPWPLLGYLPAFYKDKVAFLDRCAESARLVLRLPVGGPTMLLRELSDLRSVLQEGASNFAKSPLISGEQGQRILGQGVLTSSGDRHRRLRAALQPVFSRVSAM
jgi:cytochrome P450